MSLEEIKKEAITFFSEAIKKWSRLIELYNEAFERHELSEEIVTEADKIFAWFQENYVHNIKYSRFSTVRNLPNGRQVTIDPIFDIIFRGANIQGLCSSRRGFDEELNQGGAHLRGHLSSIKDLESLPKEGEKVPLVRIRKILSKFHLVESQLKRRRVGKTPYLIEDEYDVQDLLHALLRLDFDDIRKEEWTPSYAGGASRIDLVLKNEGIVIEAKKTSKNLREGQIGNNLIVDIEKYKEYPNIHTLICFIYDSERWIENPKGLEKDLERKSTQKLNVEVFICPKSD